MSNFSYLHYLKSSILCISMFGLFCASNLHNELDKYKIKNQYLNLRLKELTNAFFTLKISHDKLESIYIIQPASIRFVISEILEANPDGSILENAKIHLKYYKNSLE